VKSGIHELVESNRGTSYTQYKTTKGYDKHLVLNYQLPHAFQNKTTINEGVGIDNKGIRNDMIINRLHDAIKVYGENCYHEIIFEQLKTFTCNISPKSGKHMWGPMNKKYFNDDALFSYTFSYICGELCFPELEPINMAKESLKQKIEYIFVRDSNLKLRRVAVKKKAA
jgi:hypothetical protein